MSQIIQFRLSPQDTEKAFEALERTNASNLNMLSKQVFLEFLDKQGGQAKQLEAISVQLRDLTQMQEEALDLMRAQDPDTALSVMSAVFLLMYRSVNAGVRTELDAAFNSDAIINFLKQEG
jgi:hypothetical protein